MVGVPAGACGMAGKGSSQGDPGEAREGQGGRHSTELPRGSKAGPSVPAGRSIVTGTGGQSHGAVAAQSLWPHLAGRQIFKGITKQQKNLVCAKARAAEDPMIHG